MVEKNLGDGHLACSKKKHEASAVGLYSVAVTVSIHVWAKPINGKLTSFTSWRDDERGLTRKKKKKERKTKRMRT